ncbi:hypothetical protein CXG81DRAFT_16284 [Caulochytrium protostelioides]|uniref:Uncharacterized protein n=1 Tax=Caulochytrium protostelioides TaxID=1555241 RepID=A0A4V1IVJ8_9FUNG|nr:hypothetical protein CXG81DRAFT_16284 [Caulochytrium protostelioides]|eukprot:RKP04309.1 hypothetical protein CXG81DRAFT_16284 [Caulochytrium protostelioides]
MQWSDWAGPLASLVLALAGTVTAGPILGSSAANMHQQLDRREFAQAEKWVLYRRDHERNNEDKWNELMEYLEPSPVYNAENRPWTRDTPPKESVEELKKDCKTSCQGDPVDVFPARYADSSVDAATAKFPTICVCQKMESTEITDFFDRFNKLPQLIRESAPLVVIGNVTQLNADLIRLVFPAKLDTPNLMENVFKQGLAALYSSSIEKEFKQAMDKDTCIVREDAKDPKQAFVYAAVLYHNLWRANRAKDEFGRKDIRPYHDANLSCMYFQMRAVGRLVWKETAQLIGPNTLYPHTQYIEIHAGEKYRSKLKVESMPCARSDSRLDFKIVPEECAALRTAFTDPEEGWFEIGGRIFSKNRGLLEKGAATTVKEDAFNPGKPKCFLDHYLTPWSKKLEFKAPQSVPDFNHYADTFFRVNLRWSDKKEQTLYYSLYPASACDA